MEVAVIRAGIAVHLHRAVVLSVAGGIDLAAVPVSRPFATSFTPAVLEFPGFAEPQTARRQGFLYGNRSAVRLMLAHWRLWLYRPLYQLLFPAGCCCPYLGLPILVTVMIHNKSLNCTPAGKSPIAHCAAVLSAIHSSSVSLF